MYDAILADGASADLVVRRMQGLARRFGWYLFAKTIAALSGLDSGNRAAWESLVAHQAPCLVFSSP